MVADNFPGVRPFTAGDSLDLANLANLYRDGLTPSLLVEGILARIDARGDDHVWIHRLSRDELMAMARNLEVKGSAGKPLYGVPFAIKDNIDLAGAPTTAACPSFAYVARDSATVVQRLVDAGAIPIGKTNLDQFATGLNGTRSPYGAPASALSSTHVSGGSSSGSAVAVAVGLVSFSLGTDTAGSGRVPAAFNNLIGLKPTKGFISTRGVVPACRSLDCVSIFALTADDARDVLAVAGRFDPADPFSRTSDASRRPCPQEIRGTRFGVPESRQLDYFGNAEGARLFDALLRRIQKMGGELVEIDFAPFLETARLLYEGPWIAERYVAIRDFIDRHPDALFPVTRQIIGGGAKPLAADAFAAYYRLKELQRIVATVWRTIDVLITPTAGRHYMIAEMLADPIKLNSNLGYYTNFMNLLDLAAVAAPAGIQSDGLAFGATLAAPAWSDQALCALADSLHREQNLKLGALDHNLPPKPSGQTSASQDVVRLAVCGAHMSGLPLNHQLTERGARLHRRCHTAAAYRLFALPGGPPARPGLLRVENGRAIEVEVWEVPIAAFGSFVAGIPGPLGIGSLELEDGEYVKGFICEAHGTKGARDITDLGGWRRYLMAESATRVRQIMSAVRAEPYEFDFQPSTVALVIIDMQRDFVDPGGFGEALGNDVSLLRKAVPPTIRVLNAARKAGLFVIHTREGHRPDLADLPPAKKARGRLAAGIGDPGPMGRILVRGEHGHDIIDELKPAAGEPVVDKPGKGAFYATDLDAILKSRGIKQLIVCGVTTEVCVSTTVREANDRGYDCLVLEDCVASYFPEFQKSALEMVKAQGGIFGWVGASADLLPVLESKPQDAG